ncbi:PsiF family protein [Cupriavidus basilensis]
MKQCLSAKGVQPTKSQQEKMSACSKEGKGKKGDEYKSFMKECLSK